MIHSRFLITSILLLLFGVAVNIVAIRTQRQGNWFPQMPIVIDDWRGVDRPLPPTELIPMGNPSIHAFDYANSFEEKVSAQVVAPRVSESYDDPFRPATRFVQTAEQFRTIPGTNQVLYAQVYYRSLDKVRYMIYTWLQDKSGQTSTLGLESGGGSLTRLRRSWGSMISKEDRCLVRAFVPVMATDTHGLQARQSLDQIATGLYQDILRQGRSEIGATPLALDAVKQALPTTSVASSTIMGEDRTFLEDQPPAEEKLRGSLLPLKAGNNWSLTMSVLDRPITDKAGAAPPKPISITDTITVLQPALVGQEPGMVLEMKRGTVPFRREVYREDKTGLYLLAFGQATKPLIQMSSAVPLVKYPMHLGDSHTWVGKINVQGEIFPARAVSRVTGKEPITTKAGRFAETYRLDTIITLERTGTNIQFPTIRWMAPGIGFIRRNYADKGNPAFGVLTAYSVK
jgi:hypothetical protein